MSEFMNNTIDWLDEVDQLPEAAIALATNQMTQAANLSQGGSTAQQWQTYQNALALLGFEQWLRQRSRDITINRENCSLLQSGEVKSIPAVCNIEAGSFKVCLLATGDLEDRIDVPQAAIAQPELTAHFYVAVEVKEEQQQVIIRGFLRHDQLVRHQQNQSLQPSSDRLYSLPFAWFEQDPDRLLLHLRCLEPSAIPLPVASLPDTRPTPDTLLTSLTQRALNTRLWLQEQWDELAQELSWVLLPPPASASMLRSTVQSSFRRSPGEEFEAILHQLERTGLRLPTEARGAYRDWIMANIPLRLYAVVGNAIPVEATPEWSLLLVLGAQPRANLPQGITLEISDPTGVLVERTLDSQASADYLFAQVSGTWDEAFLVSITLPNGERLTLPPFAFQPE